jgi:hypothetical protein
LKRRKLMIASSSGLGFLSDKRYKRPAAPTILAAISRESVIICQEEMLTTWSG